MIGWPVGVNRKVRRETTGSVPVGVKSDTTRCGRKRTRPADQLQPETFSVTMKFRYTEFIAFRSWFDNECRRGAMSFAFPRINGLGDNDMAEYRFSPGTAYEWENTSGKNYTVTMQWEEA